MGALLLGQSESGQVPLGQARANRAVWSFLGSGIPLSALPAKGGRDPHSVADELTRQKGTVMCPRSRGAVGLKPRLWRPSPALLHLPVEGLHTESLSLSTPKMDIRTGQQGPERPQYHCSDLSCHTENIRWLILQIKHHSWRGTSGS